jgi:hypothetical protein
MPAWVALHGHDGCEMWQDCSKRFGICCHVMFFLSLQNAMRVLNPQPFSEEGNGLVWRKSSKFRTTLYYHNICATALIWRGASGSTPKREPLKAFQLPER